MEKVVYACHQPNFLPWIGYFNKISKADIFVLLDDVQYVKNTIANRNSIIGSNGKTLITIPVAKKVNGTSFYSYREAQIANEKWYIKTIKTIQQNYAKAPFFEKYSSDIFELLKTKDFCELNINFIKYVCDVYEIDTELMIMSEIPDLEGKKNDMLINIGKFLKANVYLSGTGAQSYNDEDQFLDNNISIQYQSFKVREYAQLVDNFIPYLSVIDLLFNVGPDGEGYIKNN